MTVDLKFRSRDINLSSWCFDSVEDNWGGHIEKLIAKCVSGAIRATFRDNPPSIEFESDGKSITVHINLGSDKKDDGWIYMSADIEQMINDFIDITDEDNMDGGIQMRLALASRLQNAANKLKKASK